MSNKNSKPDKKRKKVSRYVKTDKGNAGQVLVSSDVSDRTLAALANLLDAAYELEANEVDESPESDNSQIDD